MQFFLVLLWQKRIFMTILYLVRHGETIDNANKIMQGQTQGELNANGRSRRDRWRRTSEESISTPSCRVT